MMFKFRLTLGGDALVVTLASQDLLTAAAMAESVRRQTGREVFKTEIGGRFVIEEVLGTPTVYQLDGESRSFVGTPQDRVSRVNLDADMRPEIEVTAQGMCRVVVKDTHIFLDRKNGGEPFASPSFPFEALRIPADVDAAIAKATGNPLLRQAVTS
ncbi:hypothetical protein ABIC83_002767 [Roseateles asaccharophilus]|uniref:hypothetical protein n=1 Tax=Roseateles asaccharophilus TaxID=582607 RepID=UPI003832BE33